MSTIVTRPVARRGFLARLGAAASGAALAAIPRRRAAADSSSALAMSALAPGADPDAWIERMTGRDRLLLHARPKLAPALGAAAGILNGAAADYGVPEADNSIAIAVHGPAIAGVLGDALWARYPLGEIYGFRDAEGRPVAASPFLAPQPGESPQVVVTNLQRRGVTFVVCSVAVRNLAKKLVGGDASALDARHRELLAGLVPGVVAVPNVLVSISHAQRRGVGYLFIDG